MIMNRFEQPKNQGLVFCFVLLLFIVQTGTAAWGKESKSDRGKKSSKVIQQKSSQTTCTTFTEEDIRGVLKKLDASDVKIVSWSDSAAKGFCEIVIESRRKPYILYVDVNKKYVMMGSLIGLDPMVNFTAETIRKIKDNKKVDISAIPLNEALVVGETAASKKVILFTDPDCGFCGQLHKTIKQIALKRKDISFYIKFFPLDFHKDAYWKAKSVVCSKSMKMLEDNFDRKEIKKVECNTEEIDNSKKLAQSLGFGATPTIIMPDGRVREGALPEDELIQTIDGKM